MPCCCAGPHCLIVIRMELARSECDEGKGDPVACNSVGEFISAVRQDRAGAAAVFTKNCMDSDYAPSCFHLGRLYLKGAGVAQNDKEAAKCFGEHTLHP
jgi:TPR repeat protein